LRPLLIVTLVFIVGLAALTVADVVQNGVTPISVVSVAILAFFWVAIVGALRERRPPSSPK
jgi:hypothetical protein